MKIPYSKQAQLMVDSIKAIDKKELEAFFLKKYFIIQGSIVLHYLEEKANPKTK